jgi:hypothetical protein
LLKIEPNTPLMDGINIKNIKRTCESTFMDIDELLNTTRSELSDDLNEDGILACVGQQLIEDKVRSKLQLIVLAHANVDYEIVIDKRNEQMKKYKRFEEKRIQCMLKKYKQFIAGLL